MTSRGDSMLAYEACSEQVTCRLAQLADVEEITNLFRIRFPWLNHRSDARVRTRDDIAERLEKSNSITLVCHFDGSLLAVLRGAITCNHELVIDAFCSNDLLEPELRTIVAPTAFRLVFPEMVKFAYEKNVELLTFDTHVPNLLSVVKYMIRRLRLPMQYIGSNGRAHTFGINYLSVG